eukprot:TRINITY_DN515_c0_g1_i1.p1 TRINITY_DN515_c0_g1~~TRINITY_DN515_c0_g1_i1.p1  ORF type:complete len:1037 (-),score=231.97 TRINITY_DN515_c0_g1_i1:2792-5548(-)
MEAVMLLSSDKYSEKHLGYLACTLLLNETSELLTLITNSVGRDLASRNELFQCLALTAIANVGGKEFSEALASEVQRVLLDRRSSAIVVKKAALTLLRLYRKYPEILPPDSWSGRVISLLDSQNLGVVTSVASLLVGLISGNEDAYATCVSHVIRTLAKILLNREFTRDYLYFGIPSPWLQVKLLRILQYYPPPEDKGLYQKVIDVLHRIISGTDEQKNQNKNNALHAPLFEAINVVIRYGDPSLLAQAVSLLGRYLPNKDSNLKYLSLETMSRVAMVAEGDVLIQLRKHQDSVILSLKDPDISIRRRALDVLYCTCDKENVESIVEELLDYLKIADFAIRGELVLRVALLAENFASSFKWYVDIILRLIHLAGDFVSDEVWFRVVQIVANTPDVQTYAATNILKEVQSPTAHEIAVRLGGYILGEFGDLISSQPGCSPLEQFQSLRNRFATSGPETKALLLTSFVKMMNAFHNIPEVVRGAKEMFARFSSCMDSEMQQRAIEYLHLGDISLISTVLDAMPPFEDRESSVLRLIKDRQHQTVDRSVWKAAKEKSEEDDEEKDKEKPVGRQKRQVVDGPSGAGGEGDLVDLGGPTPGTTTGSAPKPGGSDDILDLLSGGSATATPTTTGGGDVLTQLETTTATSSSANAGGDILDDLLGGGGGSVMPATGDPASSNNTGVSPQTIESWFKILSLRPEGVLFEDARMQIGIKSEYRQEFGRVAIFVGNKTGTNLARVSLTLQSIPSIRVQTSTFPPMITPRTQAQMNLQIIHDGIIEDPPMLSVSYEHESTTYHVTLRIPCLSTKFCTPLPVSSKDEFFSNWKAIPEENEKQEIFRASRPIETPFLERMVSMGLRHNVCKGVDPNPANIVSSGMIVTSRGKFPVLLRLEVNMKAQAYRLTVRSTSRETAEKTAEIVKSQL